MTTPSPGSETLSPKDRAIATVEAVYFALIDPIVARPIRALGIAYSYVLSGKKVEKPYEWGTI